MSIQQAQEIILAAGLPLAFSYGNLFHSLLVFGALGIVLNFSEWWTLGQVVV